MRSSARRRLLRSRRMGRSRTAPRCLPQGARPWRVRQVALHVIPAAFRGACVDRRRAVPVTRAIAPRASHTQGRGSQGRIASRARHTSAFHSTSPSGYDGAMSGGLSRLSCSSRVDRASGGRHKKRTVTKTRRSFVRVTATTSSTRGGRSPSAETLAVRGIDKAREGDAHALFALAILGSGDMRDDASYHRYVSRFDNSSRTTARRLKARATTPSAGIS